MMYSNDGINIEDFLFGVMTVAMLENNQKLHLFDYGVYPNYLDGSTNLGFRIMHERDLKSNQEIVYIRLNDKTLEAKIEYVIYRDTRGYEYIETSACGLEDIAIKLEEKILIACSKMDSRW